MARPRALSEVGQTLRPSREDRHGPLPPLLLALTFVTGLVDAVSYLKLGHVFVANMTGNVVFLGFALAAAPGLSAAASLAALGCFLLGALLGGALGVRSAGNRAHLLRAACALQACLVAASFVCALAATAPLAQGIRYVLIAVLALAMGVQNAAAQRLSVPELTTTVLTRTLTGLASESRLLGGPGAQAGRRALAVAAMLLGALAGALLALEVSLSAPLALAAAIALTVALAVHRLSARSDAWLRE